MLATQPETGPGPGARVLDPDRLGDHLDRLYRAALALSGSREEAEDLVQETYARVLSRPRFLRRDDDLSYLLRALRNTFFSERRRQRRRPAIPMTEELDRIEDEHTPQPESAAEASLVFEAVAALAPSFRDAIVAVDVLGLRYDEAARALRIPVGTLTSRLYRAHRKLANELRTD